MKLFNLKNYVRGWIIGNFEPSIIKTPDYEVGIKIYKAGESEAEHYHKLAKEITIICTGRVQMNKIEYVAGDIILIETGDITDFSCLQDSVTVVVKTLSVKDDKYVI